MMLIVFMKVVYHNVLEGIVRQAQFPVVMLLMLPVVCGLFFNHIILILIFRIFYN